MTSSRMPGMWVTRPQEATSRTVREGTSAGSGAAEWAALALAAGVALLGFATSFQAVANAMAPDFGVLAPLVPLGVDLGILASSGAYISLARRGEAPPWLRWVPHSLVAATVYLNWAAGSDLAGKVAHAVMVLLWAIAVEAAAHVAKRRLGVETGARMDRIRRSRWLLAPLSTLLLWRRMVLWEVTSYTDALDRERRRIMARAALRETYGRRWRWRAPYRQRMLLRLGELAPAAEWASLAPGDTATVNGAATPAGSGTEGDTDTPSRPDTDTEGATARRRQMVALPGHADMARSGGKVGAMRAYWDREVAAGRVPTGAALARQVDAAASLGRRYAAEWRTELGHDGRDTAGPGGELQ